MEAGRGTKEISMLKNIYAIGSSLLFNAQSAIGVHGQNMANASTPGYRRRTVDLRTNPYIQMGPHQFGTGVDIQQLRRHFDTYIATQQQEKNGEYSMWQALKGNLSPMDSMFRDSATKGLTKALTDFWNQWQTVGEHPGQDAARTGLLGKSTSLINLMQNKQADMQRQMQLMDKAISQETGRINKLMSRLAEVNRQIVSHDGAGELDDVRDKIIEDMSSIVPIKSIIRDNGQATVSLKAGQTLVDGVSTFQLKFEGPRTVRDLIDGSSFEGTVHYEGKSNSQYTVECISSGPTDGSGGAATFKVSLDNGKTWLSNSDGSTKVFTADGPDNKIKVGNISIWFGKSSDSALPATTDLTKGDRFEVKPKHNLYWYKTSSTFEDVTPDAGNEKALTGGSIAGLLKARDQFVAKYGKTLDAFAHSLIWDVNFTHSQGAGSRHFPSVVGSYKADDVTSPISQSSLIFADRIKAGNFSIAVYDQASGTNQVVKPVDFSSIAPPGIPAFDPAVHSLENVRDAINASFAGQATASIEDGKLRISGTPGRSISFAGDTSGLLAGLGINTFFSGSNSSDIALNADLKTDISRICAGHVNGAGEVNSGDNTTARALADLSTRQTSFSLETGTATSSFQEFISNLVAQVGTDTATAESASLASNAQLKFLNDRQEEVGGVNVKEEMVKIKQYQQHYQMASQLIKTANEMYDTLLALK